MLSITSYYSSLKNIPQHHWNIGYLLFVSGTGGLLYGIDVGIIAGALPYLESSATELWHLSTQQLGFIVAAVLLGSVVSSLLAGSIADFIGRRSTMLIAGLFFCVSIPVIAMADGYAALLVGRLLQGISGGLIGVVAPLYLAESLNPQLRGRGTALFQLLLTIGLVLAALTGLYYAQKVELVSAQSTAQELFSVKDQAWRNIFWVCLVPGVAFTAGVLKLSESPRWLLQRGRFKEAREALLLSRTAALAEAELQEIQYSIKQYSSKANLGTPYKATSIFSRRYIYPFVLACVILACNQATGINSILAYAVNILHRAGLPGSIANQGDVAIKIANAIMTAVALLLVDLKGRKFLLSLGTAGIVFFLLMSGILFQRTEYNSLDLRYAMQASVINDELSLQLTKSNLRDLGAPQNMLKSAQINVAYSYGGFTNVQTFSIKDDESIPLLKITRATTVEPDSAVGKIFRKLHLNPFADPLRALNSPLHIEKASISPVPSETTGWLVAACLLGFVASFAIGPGVCVWLALSELMPNRIRSTGMSVALLINQFVSTVIATIFLPTVGRHGYAMMFFVWASFTVIYYSTVVFALPETKGKTLEEIEDHFANH